MVKPVGVLDDIVVLVASWEYPVDFMVVESKDPSKGHPIILGRPWMYTANAFIRCRDGEMTISNGLSTQKLDLYPPTQTVTEILWWLDFPFGDENIEDLFFPSDYSWALQEQTTKNVLNQFVSSTTCIYFPQSFAQLDQIFGDQFQENMALSKFAETPCVLQLKSTEDLILYFVKLALEKFYT